MKIALLSDIHGNDLALQAVLDDIQKRGGVDAYWILGDLVAIGHEPVKVLEMLHALPDAHFVRGNTDRYAVTRDRPEPTFDDVRKDPKKLGQLVEVEADFSWTQGAVTAAGWLDWLAALPLEYRTVLPDGTQVLCVHAAPNKDDGPGIKHHMSARVIRKRLASSTEDLICVGHTHRPFSIEVYGQHILNPGSVSNPVGKDTRASYALITAVRSRYDVEHFRVDYDRQAVLDALEAMRHPGRDFISKHLRGEIK
ncbi:MAG: YfcE family phosphodiesterase [Candidatus Promineifilaceae bacterium]|nr:YfcE family phosphodiesterase [Candidatus Promineifilaceae bacterium]